MTTVVVRGIKSAELYEYRDDTALRAMLDVRSRVDNIPGRKATFPTWPKRVAQPLSTVSTHISILNDGPRRP